MSHSLNRLSARRVATLEKVGRHADGGGLYLRITSAGSRSWVFMTARGRQRTEIGLGPAASVSLAAARQLAGKMRDAVALGKDPRSVIKVEVAEPAPKPTFGAFAEEYIASKENGWRNHVHRHQWRQSLRDHAKYLADKAIDEVDTDDIVATLSPIWLTKAETARRVRGRIETVLNAAKALGLRPRDAFNPAMLRGHLAILLPKQDSTERGHHAALPWEDAPAFLVELRKRPAPAARCLEFIILTAARCGEAMGATWGEVDLKAKVWTVPAGRMKAKIEHKVPLSEAAIALLMSVRSKAAQVSDRVFDVDGTSRSNMAIAMLLRRMGYGHITTHGFRSTFRDWVGEETNHSRELAELALAHTIKSKSERAYRRGKALERRRALMEDWARYLAA